MHRIALPALLAIAALVLSGCNCPACGGSGLQVRTSTGLVPYVTGSVAHKNVRTEPCVPCQGTGVQAFGAVSCGLSEGLDAANSIREIDSSVRQFNSRKDESRRACQF